jgi:hypothetical protein
MPNIFKVWIITSIVGPWSTPTPFKCCVSHKVCKLYRGLVLKPSSIELKV